MEGEGGSGTLDAAEVPTNAMVMDDPIVRLAVALYHGRGAYALLLGSGVSRSAGIPTGWEIVLDLVRQLAASVGERCPQGEEVTWYANRFGVEPTYDKLLDQVTGFKVERAWLLAEYIEPTAEDVAHGNKVAQEAHRAIARLVRGGYIRVIITTNFDHLLEEALRRQNVEPRVIATPEAVDQALPLVHQQCTIVKVHGDYTSGELKNTTEELAQYDERLNRLLERIFSDFGVIVCGWSAEWDEALRAVLRENESRAYSMYWAVRGGLRDEARNLVSDRKGKAVIEIESADSFFETLEEKVTAIEQVLQSPTLTADVARATLERYLEDPYRHRIRIHNLVIDEISQVISWLNGHVYLPATPPPPEQMKAEVSELMAVLQPALAMFVAGGRWGEDEQQRTLKDALEHVMEASRGRDFSVRCVGYWAYASWLLVYAGGLAAVISDRYEMLHALLIEPTVEYIDARQRVPLTWVLGKESYRDLGAQLRRMRADPREFTPLSNQLRDDLLVQFQDIAGSEVRYDAYVDRFEYLFALAFRELAGRAGEPREWAPVGRFSWRSKYDWEHSVMVQIEAEVLSRQASWPLLRVGFFGGDFERFDATRRQLNDFIAAVQRGQL